MRTLILDIFNKNTRGKRYSYFNTLVFSVSLIFFFPFSFVTAQQQLHGHVPLAIAQMHLQPISRMDSTKQLNLAISLPLRNLNTLNKSSSTNK